MSTPQIASTSHLNSKPKAITQQKFRDGKGRVRSRPVVTPLDNLHQVDKLATVYTQSVKAVPHNLFRNNGAKFSATLEQKAFYLLDNLTLKITLSVDPTVIHNLTKGGGLIDGLNQPTNGIWLYHPSMWFNRIEMRGNNGSENLTILHDDNMFFNLASLDNLEGENMGDGMGLTYSVPTADQENQLQMGYKVIDSMSRISKLSTYLPYWHFNNSNEISIYYPFIGSWLESADLWWKSVDGDLIFDFFPAPSIVRQTGTDPQSNPDHHYYDTEQSIAVNNAISVTSMEFVVDTISPSPEDIAQTTAFYDDTIVSKGYLEVTRVDFNNHKLAPGVQSKLELDALTGDYAFLVCVIRDPSIPRTAQRFVDVGKFAKIDVLDPGSRSLLGSGSSIDYTYLKNFLMSRHFNNRFLQGTNHIVIPFGNNVQKSFKGFHDGSHYFDGSRFYLSITPSAVPGDAEWSGNKEFEVLVYGYKFANITMNKGFLSVSK